MSTRKKSGRRADLPSSPPFFPAQAPAYVHAPKMYDIGSMKNRKATFGAMAGGAVFFGFGIPFWAVHYTNSKL